MKNILFDLNKEVNEYFNRDSYYIFHKALEGKYKTILQNKERTINYFESLGYKCEIDKPYLTPLIHIYKIRKNNLSNENYYKQNYNRLNYYECLGYSAHQYTNYLICGGPFI